jgi:cytoplasmic iron level regulating protein YaaA (DUF328/UPF0246 family)
MLLTISPAKTLDFSIPASKDALENPYFINESSYLVDKLKKLSVNQLKSLMDISEQLALLNYERFQEWKTPFDPALSREAIRVFKGEVYVGIEVDQLASASIDFLQENLIILSGLYGALKPKDQILAYRLEMGSSFKVTPTKNNLYKFWGDKITTYFNQRLEEENSNILINLASNEYFKVIDPKKLKADIIVPEFKDLKNGSYKVLSFFAKKARGKMLRFIAENKIQEPEHIKSFDSDGYIFNHSQSTKNKWVFTRDH